MTSSMIPGAVLGGRYRLDDLLDDIDGARFWRATDTVLARSVAVHALDESDPRVDAMLEGARVSATVTDPHLLRVLDADIRDGMAWVINEWGSGQSLDEMITGGRVLPPDRAAWLVREVAAAIAVAHRQGIAHGRLVPENVMVTESGTVRLIGFAIDSRLRGSDVRNGNYPDADDITSDLFDLVGLLYTGLVGRWPGASVSAVSAAPRDAHGPLRPRQVRAGVPRPLDAICDRVLAHPTPGRTAHQLAAVLTEYIGELATADPGVITSSEAPLPALVLDEREDPDEPVSPDLAEATAVAVPVLATPAPDVVPLEEPGPEPEPESEPAPGPEQSEEPEPTEPEDEGEGEDFAPEDVPWDDEPEAGADPEPEPEPAPDPDSQEPDEPEDQTELFSALPDETPDDQPEPEHAPDPEATQVSVPAFEEPLTADDDTDWHRPREGEPAAPPPPLEPVAERPLFAPEGTRRTPKGTPMRSETHDWNNGDTGSPPSHDSQTDSTGPIWPFGQDPDAEPDDWEERTKSHWLRTPLIILLALAAAGAVAVVWFLVGGKATDPGSAASPDADPSSSTSTVPAGQTVKPAGTKDFDPFGDPPEENPDEAGNAIDGDKSTAWTTLTYRGRPNLGGLKPGVGLVVDLGSIQNVGSVVINLQGSTTDLSLYAAPTSADQPTNLDGLKEIAQKNGAGEQVQLKPRSAVRARYLVVWLTSLPPVDGGFRGAISEITVRS